MIKTQFETRSKQLSCLKLVKLAEAKARIYNLIKESGAS